MDTSVTQHPLVDVLGCVEPDTIAPQLTPLVLKHCRQNKPNYAHFASSALNSLQFPHGKTNSNHSMKSRLPPSPATSHESRNGLVFVASFASPALNSPTKQLFVALAEATNAQLIVNSLFPLEYILFYDEATCGRPTSPPPLGSLPAHSYTHSWCEYFCAGCIPSSSYRYTATLGEDIVWPFFSNVV